MQPTRCFAITKPACHHLNTEHRARYMCEREREGIDYYFRSHEIIEQGTRSGEFLAHAEIYGNLYGTTYEEVEQIYEDNKI